MASERTFDVATRADDGWLVVTPVGELDIATVGRVREVIDKEAPAAGVELDLSRLTFLDTSGLQLIVEIQRKGAAEGFGLRIVPGNKHVQRVFEIAGLDRVLPFVER